MNEEPTPLEAERRDGRVVLSLRGEIDLSNAEDLRSGIEQAVDGSPDVVLDLSAVDYVDSQGLRLVSQLSKRLAREGSKLQVIAPPGSFARGVLELTLIAEDVEVIDTIDG